jgi:hypothetical protein
MTHGKKALLAALVLVALAAGVVVARASLKRGGESTDLGTFHGARLGMTASAVRARFVEPALGTWQSLPRIAGDEVLAWSASKGEENVRFELHSGMLVAVRATVAATDDAATRPALETSRAVVRTRATDGGLVHVTILARDCPTHAAEAARLAAGP